MKVTRVAHVSLNVQGGLDDVVPAKGREAATNNGDGGESVDSGKFAHGVQEKDAAC